MACKETDLRGPHIVYSEQNTGSKRSYMQQRLQCSKICNVNKISVPVTPAASGGTRRSMIWKSGVGLIWNWTLISFTLKANNNNNNSSKNVCHEHSEKPALQI